MNTAALIALKAVWMPVAKVSRSGRYCQLVHLLNAALHGLPSLHGALTGTRRSSSSVKSSPQWQTKLFKQHLHQRLTFASYSGDNDVKTTLERCGPFSLVVLSQRRSQVTPLSGHSDQNASETFSNKLQLNKVQSSLRQTSAKTTQVRSKAKTS